MNPDFDEMKNLVHGPDLELLVQCWSPVHHCGSAGAVCTCALTWKRPDVMKGHQRVCYLISKGSRQLGIVADVRFCYCLPRNAPDFHLIASATSSIDMAGPRDARVNPWKNRKESKSREISRLLTHRAHLRKKYFKMIEKEDPGSAPVDGHKSENSSFEAKDKPKLNFAERSKIAKERKERQRKEKLQNIREQRENAEKKKKDREAQKAVLAQKTRTGQPLMGPRINSLLDKIKESRKN